MTQVSQPSQYPQGKLPDAEKLRECVSQIVDEVGTQNLTMKTLRKRVEGHFGIDFIPHKPALIGVVDEKLREPSTRRQMAAVAKSRKEGLVACGTGAKKGTKKNKKGKSAKSGSNGDRKSKKEGKSAKPEGYPKQNQNAYMLFANAMRGSLDKSLGFLEQNKKLGDMYKAMSADDKAKYDRLAEEDKARFKRELDAYVAGGGEVVGRSSAKSSKKSKKGGGKAKSDANLPKRPMSAFFLFSNDVRSTVMAENPALKFIEVAGVISKRWNELGAEAKAKFEAAAQADKERYERECKERGIVRKTRSDGKSPGKKRARKEKDEFINDGSDSDSDSGSDSTDSDSDSSSDSGSGSSSDSSSDSDSDSSSSSSSSGSD